MNRICYRKLTYAEINWKILTLSTRYRNKFPAPRENIRFVDENGNEAGNGKMHSSGNTRIDGLTWWYNRHPNMTEDTTIGIYKDDNSNYMIKLETDIEVDETLEQENVSNTCEENDNTSYLVEKPLERYLSSRLKVLEDNLRLVGTQYPLDYENNRWYIDILAKDKNDNLVVIELKAGVAKEGVYSQISKYIAVINKTHLEAKGKKVRGIIVANEFTIELKLAVSNMPEILLKKYNMDFRFEDVQ
jgi:predicted nuclease of restriction endonuclease-like (RecB) superfamily